MGNIGFTTPSILMIAGTTEHAKSTKFTDKTRDNGSYLSGIDCDMNNVAQYYKNESQTVFNVVRNMKNLSKYTVLKEIEEYCKWLMKEKNEDDRRGCIYYTGHGETNTGNWCFKDGTVSLDEILQIVKQYKLRTLAISSDCCYAGNWAIKLTSIKHFSSKCGISFHGASWPGRVAKDTKYGGKFTLFQSKKSENDVKWVQCAYSKRAYSNNSASELLYFKGKEPLK